MNLNSKKDAPLGKLLRYSILGRLAALLGFIGIVGFIGSELQHNKQGSDLNLWIRSPASGLGDFSSNRSCARVLRELLNPANATPDQATRLKMDSINADENWIQTLNIHATSLALKAQMLSKNDRQLESYYWKIKNQLPTEGYTRALSAAEVVAILEKKQIPAAKYFSNKNQPAHVGHNYNFIFIRCYACPDSFFRDGDSGSGMQNTQPISIDMLELIIPKIPTTKQ